MGAALKRPFKMYNVDVRAQKVLEKQKIVPQAAPRYPTEAAIQARNRASKFAEEAAMHKKHPELDTRLKHVYVESEGTNPQVKSTRKLPQDRSRVVDPEFGYLEPVVVTAGKIPLRLAMEMINSHKDDPEANSASVLAERYNLSLQTTHLILKYFLPFNLKLPKAEEVVQSPLAMLRGPSLKMTQKKLDNAQKLIDDYSSKRKT